MRKENRSAGRCRLAVACVCLLGTGAFGALQTYLPAPAVGAKVKQEKITAGEGRQVKIDMNKAVAVALPEEMSELKPARFKTSDGKEGWALKIPGNRPIATPAYADGVIFVGGGYGSHEFYAFDAGTGALRWQMKTSDDGPTAAVVEDGYVAFNTESCTLVVADAKTGKVVWEEWLGDPLMSQPAISEGRVYMAHPANGRGGAAHAQQNIMPHAQASAASVINNTKGDQAGGHRLLCADLKTGRHIWESGITSDVISAPIVSGDKIYFTCFDGTSYCLDAHTGVQVWKKTNAGTSAPLVAGGQVLMTQKEVSANNSYEGIKRLDAAGGADKDAKLIGREKADYLDESKGAGGNAALTKNAQSALDSSVGFGSAPAAANLGGAKSNVAVSTVAGGWAYQGSRAAYSRGRMMNAQGRYLNSINAEDGRFAWRAEVSGTGVGENAQIFSPPALGHDFMYLSSSLGHLVSVRQDDGAVGFLYTFRQPMVFQPALAEGNVYVGTNNGLLICLKTGDTDADGWYAWGGNAEHNKNK
ncbi:MAG: PQQ-binding-like beta-propeller repeat protein [Pyrinomonadaceae bacterium]